MPGPLVMSDVMTPAPKTISASAHLTEAKEMMEKLGINYLPVIDGTVVESIITDRDIKRFTLPAHKISEDENLLVKDIATTRTFVAEKNDPLSMVLEQMVALHTDAVVVLNEGELAGIFTDIDACRVLANLLKSQAAGDGN